MTTEEALTRLAEETAEAVVATLSGYAGGDASHGPAAIVPEGVSPLQGADFPAVATSVAYVEGVRGGNVFLVTALGARRLAALMAGEQPPADGDVELTELEVTAVAEVTAQMMREAASATGRTLGQEVAVSPPETRFLASRAAAADAFEASAHATAVPFTLCGEPALFVQLVPNAFVVRMTKALSGVDVDEPELAPTVEPGGGIGDDALHDVPVRVWAELGRTRMPVGRAVALSAGALVELDAGAEDSVEVFVNGHLLARGRLLLSESGDWAVRLDEIVAAAGMGAALQSAASA